MKKILIALLAIAGITAQAQIRIDSDNNLRMGNGSDLRFASSTSSRAYGIEYWNGGLNFWTPYSSNADMFIKASNNYIGIGTANPFARFHIEANDNEPALRVRIDGETKLCVTATGGVLVGTINATVDDRDLFVSGDIYANTGSWTTSDRRMKEQIENLNNSLSILKKLNGVSYFKKIDDNFSLPDSLVDSSQRINGVPRRNGQRRKEFGLIAQDVEQVIPNLVKTMGDGTKAVAYTELIAVLIEAVKEQQAQIELLEKEVKQCCKKSDDVQDSKSMLKSEAGEETTSAKSTSNKAIVTGYGVQEDDASLAQNNPNPFDQTTTIEMTIPETVADATVYVYDLNGTQKLSVPVHMRGATNVTVSANELEPGMYIYSLVTDGVLVGSKQMILTE